MGMHPNVNPLAGRFPRQGDFLHARVRVVFDYDSSRDCTGIVVRDDDEEPWEMIISLDDGPVVRSTECQWSPLRTPTPDAEADRE